ncbi:MAG TPA: hypothetical protein VF290_28420 [Pyrinomonadaceae bacterium]
MKRCPQCEFIYEDDQSLCDMDGVLLVLDSRNLPNHQALATVPAKPQSRRNRAVPAFATLILALVLGMVYYVSTQRNATPPVIETPSTAASTSIPAPEVNPTPQPEPSMEPVPVPAAEEPKPAPTKQPATAPVKKASAKTTSTTTAKEEPKKDDNKVGSILKKTGRILKKPFKL